MITNETYFGYYTVTIISGIWKRPQIQRVKQVIKMVGAKMMSQNSLAGGRRVWPVLPVTKYELKKMV